jgi:chemotaxis protein CheZ
MKAAVSRSVIQGKPKGSRGEPREAACAAPPRELAFNRSNPSLARGEDMATPRNVFRIEQWGAGRLEQPSSDANDPRDHAILRELGASRAMLAPMATVPHPNGSRPRQDERQRLISELRIVLAAVRGQPHAKNGSAKAPPRMADELDAVIQDSDVAAQRILAAAEQIDQAANNLVGLLKGNFERGLAQDIRDRVTQIFEACNFQDLTSQRVAKVRASFERLDRQIAGTLDELVQTDTAPPPHGPRLGDDTGHVSQSDIDSLFEGDAGAAR